MLERMRTRKEEEWAMEGRDRSFLTLVIHKTSPPPLFMQHIYFKIYEKKISPWEGIFNFHFQHKIES